MSQGDRTHVAHFDLPIDDSRKVSVEIVDIEGPHLPHGAEPHQTRCVWATLVKGHSFKDGDRTLVHQQRFIRPDVHERLLATHTKLSNAYSELREQIVRLQASVGYSEEETTRVALRDVLADDYRDHRRCTKEKCAWCRAEALLNPGP